MLTSLQTLPLRRGVIRCADWSSPSEWRTLSIQPKHSSTSTTSCHVTEGRPLRLR